MRYTDKIELRALFFYTIYALGLTVGAIAGRGGEVLTPDGGPQYMLRALLCNLPFFLIANIPGRRAVRVTVGMGGAAIYGALMGAGGVAALASPFPGGAYIACVLPSLLAIAPILVFILCINTEKNDIPFTVSTITVRLLLSSLLAIFASCVQFAIFLISTQFH